jgi:3-oxoadipate enol-lactonase
VLVLSHSIGCDHSLWAQQVPDLLQDFQVLRYDTRGHGASDAPKAEYSIERLGRDVLGLVDSLGGMIGQWLGINAPDRLTGLVLANTSPRVSPKSNWDEYSRAGWPRSSTR